MRKLLVAGTLLALSVPAAAQANHNGWWWNNPPGPIGGHGTNWDNRTRPFVPFRHNRDHDGNPPGWRGGPGTNWENPPGPWGGPGASPDRRSWRWHPRWGWGWHD